MYKKSIIFVLLLVFLLGMFYQINRTDAFLYFMKNQNAVMLVGNLKSKPAFASSVKEKYLLIYDNTDIYNILLKRNIERLMRYHKKDLAISTVSQKIDTDLPYHTIILAVNDLEKIRDMPLLRSYVREGGSLIFAVNPEIGPTLTDMSEEIGFKTLGPKTNVSGIKVKSNFMLKAKGAEVDDREALAFDALTGTLRDTARVHLTSLDNDPLLWEQDYGHGKYVFYNAQDLHFKTSRGILAGMLALAKNNYLYPIMGTKIFFVDDFPLPVSKVYNDTIKAEYGLNMAEFIRQVWWPGMIRVAERHDVKYTCLYIKGYDDQIQGPFTDLTYAAAAAGGDDIPASRREHRFGAEASANKSAAESAITRKERQAGGGLLADSQSLDKSNLISYGREIMKAGSEVGLHGYNHQPLIFEPYVGFDAELGYKTWASEDDAAQALNNIRDYFAQMFADYKMMSYVPPSNILSEQGRKVLKSVFPEMSVISAVYYETEDSENSYVQEFGKGRDGIYDIPRVSDGYYIDSSMHWNILNALNSLGVFSHFAHPDNAFYEDAIIEMGWKKVFKHFEEYMKNFNSSFSWLRTVTATQATVYLEDFLNLDYSVYENGNEMVIDCWGFHEDVFFLLRTTDKIAAITGAEAELIDDSAYLLKISANQVKITFESGR